MKIIVITPQSSKEEEIKIIIQLFENGLKTLHLRKPKFRTKELKDYLKQIPPQFHDRIVIHSHHLLALKYNLKGIHFTKTHLKKNFRNWWVKKILVLSKANLVKTTSHTKLASLYDTTKMNFDYIFLSPIFDSLTGKYQSGFYEEGIRTTLIKTGKNVIARGGVDGTRLPKINDLGFNGLALYSYIWESKTPIENFLKLLKQCDELNISIE